MVFNHIGDSQILNSNPIVVLNKVATELVQKILPAIRNTFVLSSYPKVGFFAIGTALLFFAGTTLQYFQSSQPTTQVLWVGNLLASTQDCKIFDAQVYAYYAPRCKRNRSLNLLGGINKYTGVEFTRRCAANRNSLNITAKPAVQCRFYALFEFGQSNLASGKIYRSPLWHRKGPAISFPFEVGVPATPHKKIAIGIIQVQQRRLQTLAIDFSQPRAFLLQIHELRLQVVSSQILPESGVGLLLAIKCEIEKKAHRPNMLIQQFDLLQCRGQAVSVCLQHVVKINYLTTLNNCLNNYYSLHKITQKTTVVYSNLFHP